MVRGRSLMPDDPMMSRLEVTMREIDRAFAER
jgi:hypothetical protein